MINKSGFNNAIDIFADKLKSIGEVDNISKYDDKILNKSCYNSLELLEVFNQYKFVLCVENSYNSGYITEKIFNAFFSKTIPIYSGSDKIDYFFNSKSFVNIENSNIEKCFDLIKELSENEVL